MAAKDRQTAWDPSIYLNPALITIPQTNFKIGYFINDHYNMLSLAKRTGKFGKVLALMPYEVEFL